jgi:PilZ domain
VSQNDNEIPEHDERRAYDRSRLIVDVYFDGKDATGVASTKDISVGGFYMNTQAEIPEGSVLMVRIPFGPGREVICNAEVVYSNPGLGVGVRFHGMPSETAATLERELINE